MKISLTAIFLLGSLFLSQAQNLNYAIHLNDQEAFRGVPRVLEMEETHVALKDKTQAKTRTLTRYDAAQRIISRAVYENEKRRALDTITYYGPEGVKKATVFETWTADSSIYNRRTENYLYDTRGWLVRIREFSKGGYLRYESRIKNIVQGHPNLLDKYDDHDNLTGSTEEAEYLLEQNRYIIKKVNIMGKEMARDTFILDPRQRAANPPKGETYNEKGDLVKAVLKNQSLLYEYRYDEQDNWIEKKCFQVEGDKGKEKKVLLERWERKYHYAAKS